VIGVGIWVYYNVSINRLIIKRNILKIMATDIDNTAAAAREALQARILIELMGNALAKELVLKGGLAMRLAHGSERYTKDIDLDADPAFPKQRIHLQLRRTLAMQHLHERQPE